MKYYKYLTYILMPMLVMSMFLITSCEDEDGLSLEAPNGPAEVQYVRVTTPESSDSLLVSAQLGSTVAIMGKNLGGTREVWFNDRQANINPTWVTNGSIITAVPQVAPLSVTNKIYLVNDVGDTLTHDFVVQIPPPVVTSAKNEWPQDGEKLVINGDFFFDVVPVTVAFTGGDVAEATVISQSQIEVDVPASATEGPVTVTTNFGAVASTFHLWDSRNIVLNFDGLNGNGWRTGLVEGGDGPIDGNYLVVRGDIDANQRNEGDGASPLLMEYWGGSDPNRTENFYPLYVNSYRDYVLKFEVKVNTWYGGVLNLCLAPPDHTGSNQEIWSNDINSRGIYAPWQDAGEEFSTDGKWITVVIPLTEFEYYMGAPDDVVYTPGNPFVEAAAGSFSTWLLGSPENSGNFVEFYIDNIRFVEP